MDFDDRESFEKIDFRLHPQRYRIGRGERGVFWVQPYKSELLPLWRFKTPEVARQSADALYERYLAYRAEEDFVGMDMARKYIQMGYTRARRYANRRSGRKYDAESGALLPLDPDEEKAASAQIFKSFLDQIRADEEYRRLKKRHRARVEQLGDG